MQRLILAALLGLAGCGAHYAAEGRAWATGRSLAEVEGCVGIPDKSVLLPDGSQIVQWSAADATQSLATLPLSVISDLPGVAIPAAALAGTVPLTVGGGQCRAIATVRSGVVQSLRYAGEGDSVSGRDALCGTALLRGCLRQ